MMVWIVPCPGRKSSAVGFPNPEDAFHVCLHHIAYVCCAWVDSQLLQVVQVLQHSFCILHCILVIVSPHAAQGLFDVHTRPANKFAELQLRLSEGAWF